MARNVRLFEPLALRGITARNRIMISPMCQYSAPEAVPHEWHYVHLATRAVGGAGIVMTEATAVEPEGRISPFDVGIWNDAQQAAFARIARFVAEQGAVPGMQLAHAGRKASHRRPWEDRAPIRPEEGGWEVAGPSAIPWGKDDLVPREMTSADIDRVIGRFRASARRAHAAGFRMLEIHAAHGYLLHSFYSPLCNRRTDRYGGSFDNRIRLLCEVATEVRAEWPAEFPLSVRLSATDWADGGWALADTIELARRLKALGVDIVDCSSGGNVPEQKIPIYPGYQVPFAEAVRREAGILTATVGLISEPIQAEEIVAGGRADLIIIARMALWDPYWPYHAAKALKAEVKLPIPYARADIF